MILIKGSYQLCFLFLNNVVFSIHFVSPVLLLDIKIDISIYIKLHVRVYVCLSVTFFSCVRPPPSPGLHIITLRLLLLMCPSPPYETGVSVPSYENWCVCPPSHPPSINVFYIMSVPSPPIIYCLAWSQYNPKAKGLVWIKISLLKSQNGRWNVSVRLSRF